jgi:hypothetical protein
LRKQLGILAKDGREPNKPGRQTHLCAIQRRLRRGRREHLCSPFEPRLAYGLAASFEQAFRARRFITSDVILADDLDRALVSCESTAIPAYRAEEGGGQTLVDGLSHALGSDKLGDELAALCKRLELDKDEVIAGQGAEARSMHFIVDGRIVILVKMDDGRLIRVRSLGDGPDHQTASQRDHSGRGTERAL